MLSRFIVFEIPEYTYEQFDGVALRIVKKLHPNFVIQIASSVWKSESRDIRDVVKSISYDKMVLTRFNKSIEITHKENKIIDVKIMNNNKKTMMFRMASYFQLTKETC